MSRRWAGAGVAVVVVAGAADGVDGRTAASRDLDRASSAKTFDLGVPIEIGVGIGFWRSKADFRRLDSRDRWAVRRVGLEKAEMPG